MASEQWITIGRKYCELIEQDVAIMERRVYSANIVSGLEAYRVKERKCTAAVDCNLAGVPCSWAFTNPESDRYVLD